MTLIRKVAIWGAYREGNVGDDLMAVLFSRHVQSQGFIPVVYGLNPGIASRYDLKVADSLEELFQDAAFGVIGGGAYLARVPSSYEGAMDTFADRLVQVVDAAEAASVPFIACSVGGDGVETEPLPTHVERMVRSPFFCGCSVRLQSDAARLLAGGVPAVYFPDVVFLAAAKLGSAARTEAFDVLIHDHNAWTTRIFYSLLIPVLKLLGAKTAFLGTHLPQTPFAAGELSSHRVPHVQYTDLETYVNHLASASVVVSKKLHIGVVALGAGGRFYSFGGKPKTVGFLRQHGLEQFVISRRQPLALCRMLIGRPWKKNRAGTLLQAGEVEAAEGHIDFLTAFLQQTDSKPERIRKALMMRCLGEERA